MKIFGITDLKRKTHSTSFIPEIDGLRFFAIITVVLFHLNTALSRNFGLGADLGLVALGGKESFLNLGWWVLRLDLGVKLFFAISGFVLALPFLRYGLLGEGKKVFIGPYFVRRLTRLEPPFIISLFVFLFVHLFIKHEALSDMGWHFLAGLVYLHGILFGEPNPINPVTWSLEVEAQFYVLVPLLFWLVFSFTNQSRRLLVILILIALSVLYKNYVFQIGNYRLMASILSYFSNFGVGILFAYFFVLDRNDWLKTKSYLYDILGALCVFGVFYYYKPQHEILNNALFNLSVFGIMITAFKGKIWNYFYSRPWVYSVGGMCYSIYLLHYAFFHLLVPFTSRLSMNMGYKFDYFIQILVAVPIMLFVSTLFYIFIERPCMDKDWPRKLIRRFK